ncbi:MAG: hypothetical protein R3B70_06540 [Polyangiaceae bacterium]
MLASLRRPPGFFTMTGMGKSSGAMVLAVVIGAAGLGSAGCVSADQHRAALSDLQRLRVEAWQKSVEAAALRAALDRAAVENAQLRAYGAQSSTQALTSLAARVEEVSRKQDAMAEEMRSAPACATTAQPAAAASGTAPARERKVTDLLYSRF